MLHEVTIHFTLYIPAYNIQMKNKVWKKKLFHKPTEHKFINHLMIFILLQEKKNQE